VYSINAIGGAIKSGNSFWREVVPNDETEYQLINLQGKRGQGHLFSQLRRAKKDGGVWWENVYLWR
jgi:hypothetical protein